jgi:hypothetical protein
MSARFIETAPKSHRVHIILATFFIHHIGPLRQLTYGLQGRRIEEDGGRRAVECVRNQRRLDHDQRVHHVRPVKPVTAQRKEVMKDDGISSSGEAAGGSSYSGDPHIHTPVV